VVDELCGNCAPVRILEEGTTMPNADDLSPFEESRERRELIRVVRRLQALTVELRELQARKRGGAELEAKERALEQLRWRLANVARRAATQDQGSPA
jgi:hypothetical protein